MEDENLDFTLFENDLLTDDFVLVENGKIKEKKQAEVNTYAGYVGDNPKNFVRLSITDNRFSGMYQTDKGHFHLSHFSDNGVKETNSTTSKKKIILTNLEDEISSTSDMICGNALLPIKKSQVTPKSPNARTGSFSPTCKYVALALATDYEYFQKENDLSSQANIYNLRDKVLDMVNKMDLVLAYNSQETYNVSPVELRFKLVSLVSYTDPSDPFTTTDIAGTGVLQEFTTLINNGAIFSSSVMDTKNIAHLLTGRPMGAIGTGGYIQNQLGQANSSNLCVSSLSATSVSTIMKLTEPNGQPISYNDAWRTMLHEIGHVMGHPEETPCIDPQPTTIMCPSAGKLPYFSQVSVNTIRNFLATNGDCLENNDTHTGFSNDFKLKLNGNNIVSTPVFVNGNTKLIDITQTPNSSLSIISSAFVPSNPVVYVNQNSETQAIFAINTAPSFTFSISAANACNNFYWGVPFVYSPGGARIGFITFPNPADDAITVETQTNETGASDKNTATEKVLIFTEQGNFVREGILRNNRISTTDLKNGVYFLHLVDQTGIIQKKRILVSHN